MQDSNKIEIGNFSEDQKEKIQAIIEQPKQNIDDLYDLYRDLVKSILNSHSLETATLRLKQIFEHVKEDDDYFLNKICQKFYSDYHDKKRTKEERAQELNYCLLLTSSLSQYCNSENIKIKFISHTYLVYFYARKKEFKNSLIHKEIAEQYLNKLKDFPERESCIDKMLDVVDIAVDKFCKDNRFDAGQELNSLALKTYLLLPEQKRSKADWSNIRKLYFFTSLFYHKAGQLLEAKNYSRKCLDIYYNFKMTTENFKGFCGFLAASNYNTTESMHSFNLYKFIFQFLIAPGDFQAMCGNKLWVSKSNIKFWFRADPNLNIQDLLDYSLYIQKNLSLSPWSEGFRLSLKDLYKGMEFLVKAHEKKELPKNSVSEYFEESSNLDRFKKRIEELKMHEKSIASLTNLIEGHPSLSTGLTNFVVQLVQQNNELSSRIVYLENKIEELSNNNNNHNNNNYESKEISRDESGKNQSKITDFFQSRSKRKTEEKIMEQNNKLTKLEQ